MRTRHETTTRRGTEAGHEARYKDSTRDAIQRQHTRRDMKTGHEARHEDKIRDATRRKDTRRETKTGHEMQCRDRLRCRAKVRQTVVLKRSASNLGEDLIGER
jgi:hypothetical protein